MLPDPIQEFTPDGFTIYDDEGHLVKIKYRDLTRVTILTTDEGPWLPDFFYLLETGARVVCVEQEDPSSQILLFRLQALPGFDNEAVIRATQSTDYAEFVAWVRDEWDQTDQEGAA